MPSRPPCDAHRGLTSGSSAGGADGNETKAIPSSCQRHEAAKGPPRRARRLELAYQAVREPGTLSWLPWTSSNAAYTATDYGIYFYRSVDQAKVRFRVVSRHLFFDSPVPTSPGPASGRTRYLRDFGRLMAQTGAAATFLSFVHIFNPIDLRLERLNDSPPQRKADPFRPRRPHCIDRTGTSLALAVGLSALSGEAWPSEVPLH